MPTSIRYYINLFVLLTLSTLINCGGTGSEVGNRPLIYGQLFDTCGNPTRNAEVTIRFNDYLSPLNMEHLGKRQQFSEKAFTATRTDSKGVYEFTSDDIPGEGSYCIEAWDEQENNCIVIKDIDIKVTESQVWYIIDTPFVTTDRTLRPPVSLTGTIYPVHESIETIIRIFGLDVYEQAGKDGAFRVDNLPQGNYQLQIVTLREKPSYDTICIEIGQETTTMPDTIVPSAYRAIYYDNMNTSGSVPVDANWYDNGETVTILENITGMTRPGFIFIGWSTQPDGSGTIYNTGDTLLKGDSRITLYAQWAENQYAVTVTGKGNGTVTGTDSAAHGIPHTITATPDPGNNFSGWQVKSGNAVITDPTAAITTVTLKGEDAVVEGVFSPVNTFMKVFNGTLNQASTCVQQTSDGGYVLVGSTGSYPEPEIYLIRTDEDGTTLWTKTFGGTGVDEGYSVRETDDGGFIILGNTTSFGEGERDVYLIRTDTNGDSLWTKTFGGSGEDVGRSVIQTKDGGFVFTGSTTSFENTLPFVYIVKTDASGQVQWSVSSGVPVRAEGNAIIECDDGNYCITGTAESVLNDGSLNIFLVKVTTRGDSLWVKHYGESDDDLGYDVRQTADGGYIITGVTNSTDDSSVTTDDIYLVKTDPNGDTVWTRSYDTMYDGGYCVQQTADGGFLVGGYSTADKISTGKRNYLIKTTPEGEKSREQRFSYNDSDYIQALYSIQPSIDGGFIIAAGGTGKMYLIKTDEYGRIKTE